MHLFVVLNYFEFIMWLLLFVKTLTFNYYIYGEGWTVLWNFDKILIKKYTVGIVGYK